MNEFQHLAVAVFLTAALSFGHAEDAVDPANQTQWNVCVDVQMVSIAPQAALKLLPELVERKTVDGAFAHLQEMIASGAAELLAWPHVRAQSGMRSVAETAVELRHSDDLELPAGPGNYTGPLPNIGNFDEMGSFETRNLGPTLEIEPFVSREGRSVSLNITAQFVKLVAIKEFRDERRSWAMQWLVHRPEFAFSKVTTDLNLTNGQRVVLGSFVVAEPKPHVEIFILHAVATAAGRKDKPPSSP